VFYGTQGERWTNDIIKTSWRTPFVRWLWNWLVEPRMQQNRLQVLRSRLISSPSLGLWQGSFDCLVKTVKTQPQIASRKTQCSLSWTQVSYDLCLLSHSHSQPTLRVCHCVSGSVPLSGGTFGVQQVNSSRTEEHCVRHS